MVSQDEATYAQVERVLNSATFRNAEVLRRLLRFLADKAIAGEADQLKEYTIGIDVLGKPESYDPRQDSVVRIQVRRLRQKLAEYYQDEGKNDSIVLDVPKGHFRITWEVRSTTEPFFPAPPTPEKQVPARSLRTRIAIAVLAVWALASTLFWWQDRRDAATLRRAWTPELQELWKPFLESHRPLLIVISSPLFVGFPGSGFFRDQTVNTWEEAISSPKIQAIQKALGNRSIVQRYYYTGTGEMIASFRLGMLLNFTGLQFSSARSSQISWQQVVDNNVLFVGAPRVFGEQLHRLPVDLDFMMLEDGIHDLKPKPGQPVFYGDAYPSIFNEEASVPDNGEVHALVSHTPGPLGTGDVETFNSNHSPGTLGAVQWFTSPSFAHELTVHLRRPDGTLPRYFQLILKVKYRDGVPTEIIYVTHRELQLTRATTSAKN